MIDFPVVSFQAALQVGAVEQILWVFVCLTQGALLVKLWRQSLSRTYRFFALYLLVQLAQGVTLAFVKHWSDEYFFIYLGSAAAAIVLALLAILEIYALVLGRFAGIGTLGRWAVTAGLAVSLGVAGISLYPDLGNPADPYPVLLFFNVFQRAAYSALLLFLLFITAFVVWFPIPLSRNVILHTLVFACLFASQAILLLLRNVVGVGLVRPLSTLSLAVEGLCLLAWICFLTPAGETQKTVFGHRWRPEETERLVKQLNTINATLLRSARK